MTKTCCLMLSAAPVLADCWAGHFKTLDTVENVRITHVEWEENSAKLKLDPTPTLPLWM